MWLLNKKFGLLPSRTSFFWSTWRSRSKEVSWYFSGSAASYGAIGRLSTAQRREVSGAASSAESITSSIRMARRKTWPEGVAGRRGRKAWLKSVARRRACRIAGLFQMAEFFLGSPRLSMMPNRVSKDDQTAECTFKRRLSSIKSNIPPGP